MKVYYAHCISLYGTKQELRDEELLKKLGYEVLNPNTKEHRDKCLFKGRATMDYFLRLVATCDVVAFRALPDGKIPAGVYKELLKAQTMGIPVIELPVNPVLREMSIEHTRAYLTEVGRR